MLPSRDHHWRCAYALIALGIPLAGLGDLAARGPVVGLLVLAAGASVLRWPVLTRWLAELRVAAGAGPCDPPAGSLARHDA